MPTVITELKHRGWTAIALLVVPLVCLSLGACGSSSSGTSSSGTSSSSSTPTSAQATSPSTTPSSTTPTTTPTRTAPTIKTGNQLKRLYECLVRGGIKLPPFDQLGKVKINTTAPHYQAVLKKCEQEPHS